MSHIRVGVVPEHFSLPWHQGVEKNLFGSATVELIECPKGTGWMCRSLRSNELEVAVALTEGLVADLILNGSGYTIVGSYTNSPLEWGIVSKHDRTDVSKATELRNHTFGISRFGSGSHIMSYLLAAREGWKMDPLEIKFEVLGGMDNLVDGIETGKSDAFLWEKFMLKPFVDSKRLKYVDTIVTPWPCFMIAVRNDIWADKQSEVLDLLQGIQKSTKMFVADEKMAIERISKTCSLNEEDAHSWLKQTKFSEDGSISKEMLTNCVNVLSKVGVISAAQAKSADVEQLVRKGALSK